jgi:hypothetical protein
VNAGVSAPATPPPRATRTLCACLNARAAVEKRVSTARHHTARDATIPVRRRLQDPGSIVKGAPSNVRRLRYSGRYGAGEVYIARDPQTGEYELVESDSVPAEVGRGAVTDELLAERLIEARKVEGGVTLDTLRKAGGVKGTRADAMAKTLVSEGRLVQRKVRGGFRYSAAA